MKKRIISFLLALVLVLGLIPATATTANAYSTRDVSDKAIDILSGSMTFYAEETSNKIGYGTPTNNPGFNVDKYLNSINKDAAIDLMHDYINEIVDDQINDWAKANNIDLTQNEHDALVVNIYRGADSAKVYNAIRTVKTVNSAADRAAMVKAFVDSRSHNLSSVDVLKTTLNVSLAEAAMYLYGDYSYNADSKLGYAVLSNNGDNIVEMVVGYVKNDGLAMPEAALSESEFLGWFAYDPAKGTTVGAPITKLTKDHSGMMFVAKKATGGNDAAEYTINTKTLTDKHIYNGKLQITDTILKDNTDFKVAYEFLDKNGEYGEKGVKWVYGTGKNTKGKSVTGWVKVGKMESPEALPEKPIATATVTSATLNVRPGATAVGNTPIAALSKGDVVNVYEIKVEKTETGNQNWGKISFTYAGVEYIGWINLAYTDVNETTGESGEANGQTGKIANAENVNIRSSAGITATNYITSLKKGTKVTVLEMNADKSWAKIKWSNPSDGYTQGWVYMHYVQLDNAYAGSTATTPETVKYTGVVNTNNLNVRKSADIYAAKVDTLNYGEKVNVYETATSRNMKWGKIGSNRWVCLTYLNLTEVKQPAAGSTTTTTATQATVTSATLDVLKNYNSNAEKVGSLKKGDVVTILEKNTESTGTGSRIWGRFSKDGLAGWINLAYVELKNVTSVSGSTGSTGSTGSNANGANGVISDCISVNIREGAGVSNAQITKLNNGTAVKVYEQVTKDNAPWAKITWDNGSKSGWVCMNYVTMTAGTTGSTTEGGLVNGTNSNTISATGIVNSNIDLNVRAGAGLGYAKVGSLKKGARVTVYEQVSADGMIWGRIPYGNGSGWICMSYITIESASSTGKGVMGTVARCFAAVNVRSAPGTNNALINKINVGSRVEVFETKQVGTQLWGRVAQGWVCMDYILLDSELPPGTALDATVPTTAPTQATQPEESINRDGEIAFIIEAEIKQELNVRNDADVDSDRVGTVNAGVLVDIRAVKNNGGELWGRIDQYGTAGWILMDKNNVSYTFTRYVAVDEQPVYVDANTGSAVKATLGINTHLQYIDKITTDGTNVYGWVESVNGQGIFGWIPMDKTSEKEVNVIKTYKNGETVGMGSIVGTTYVAMDAIDSIGGTRVVFKMQSGVTVKVDEVRIENGRIWGYVQYELPGSDSGEYGYGWIDMSKVNFSVGGTVKEEMNVRKSMDSSSETNIVTTIAAGTSVSLCQFSFDGYGNLWARLNGNFGYDADTNGEFIMVCAYSANGNPGTVYIDTVVSY